MLFVVVAFGWSWAWWLPMVLHGDTVRQRDAWPSQFPGLLGPLIAAVSVTALTGGRPALHDYLRRLGRWRIGTRNWAIVIAPLIAFFAVAVMADGGVKVGDLDDISGLAQLGVPLLFVVLVVVNGFGEEGGWRGFLYPRFRHRYGLVPASCAITVVWALWHVPLFFLLASYQGFNAFILVGFVIGLAGGAVVLGWVYEHTGSSILVVAVWHGTYNIFAATGDSAVRSSVVTAGVIAWAVSIARRADAGDHPARRAVRPRR